MNTVQNIENLSKLPKGWHYGQGETPSQETIRLVYQLNEYAENYGLTTEVFPDVNGAILLSVYGWKNIDLDITVYYSDITYVKIIDDETNYDTADSYIQLEDAYELIDELASVEEYE